MERDRLREREKQARAQMSSLVAERDLEHQDGGGAPLFDAPVKVSASLVGLRGFGVCGLRLKVAAFAGG